MLFNYFFAIKCFYLIDIVEVVIRRFAIFITISIAIAIAIVLILII